MCCAQLAKKRKEFQAFELEEVKLHEMMKHSKKEIKRTQVGAGRGRRGWSVRWICRMEGKCECEAKVSWSVGQALVDKEMKKLGEVRGEVTASEQDIPRLEAESASLRANIAQAKRGGGGGDGAGEWRWELTCTVDKESSKWRRGGMMVSEDGGRDVSCDQGEEECDL